MGVSEYIEPIVNVLKQSAIFLCLSIVLFFFVLGLVAGKPFEAKASHILVDKKETADKILKEINDFSKFQSLAGSMSTCPSGKKGGDLGWFSKGSMVPPFDKVVFDPETKIGTVVGPVQTQFGWRFTLRIGRVYEILILI